MPPSQTIPPVAPASAAPEPVRDPPAASGGYLRALRLMIQIALRSLRGGLSGLGILIACIALGVAVIAGIGSLANALLSGLNNQGRELIGGDIVLRRVHRRASLDELKRMAPIGNVAEVASLRAMARPRDKSDQTLVEIKGVGSAYPLIGSVTLQSGRTLQSALQDKSGVLVGAALLERLNLKVGDSLLIGEASFRIVDVIRSEPDKLSTRLAYGPRVMMGVSQLQATGLVKPGSLVDWRYMITLAGDKTHTAQDIATARKVLAATFADSGFLAKDRRNPSGRTKTAVTRLNLYMSLLGLATLLLGGIGIGSAVSTYVSRHYRTIAIYRSLGASSLVIGGALFTQVMILSTIGVLIGLAVGACIPLTLSALATANLPFSLSQQIHWTSLGIAAGFGYLMCFVFIVWPIAQAMGVKPAHLFRDGIAISARPTMTLIAIQVIAIAGLAGFCVLVLGRTYMTLGFLGGAAVLLAAFWVLGFVAQFLVARIPRGNHAALKLALSNLAAPDGLTRVMMLALGSGLSILVGVTLIDLSMTEQLRQRIPMHSPAYYALDISRGEIDKFRQIVKDRIPNAKIATAPMLRGRIVKLNGKIIVPEAIAESARWVVNGDRGLTYSDTPGKDMKIVEGQWWPKNYTGPPLVSFGAKIGKQLGLKLGDTATINVLGRNITARVANFRTIDWESLSINFIMIFSPNTLSAAPHNFLSTIRFDKRPSAEDERAAARALGNQMPTVTLINVREAIQLFASIFEKMMVAVRIAGSITLLAGALVLSGALSAAHARRTQQAVILKALGATRSRILVAHALEYALLSVIAATFAIGVGALAAWCTLHWVLETELAFSWTVVALTLAVSGLLIAVLGGLRTWRILSVRPVPHLRSAG